MGKNSSIPLEGQSLSNPPLFDGSNYLYWKIRMKVYLMATDMELWKVVKYGLKIPTKEVKGKLVPKTLDEWDETDAKLEQINAKAMHLLYCALGVDQFTFIATCESAKEIWDRLEIIHEGNEGVKRSRSLILKSKYDSFVMKSNESISDMFSRFFDIINGLGRYSKSDSELVLKVLVSLRPWCKWAPKVAAIGEILDHSTMSLNELIYELSHDL